MRRTPTGGSGPWLPAARRRCRTASLRLRPRPPIRCGTCGFLCSKTYLHRSIPYHRRICHPQTGRASVSLAVDEHICSFRYCQACLTVHACTHAGGAQGAQAGHPLRIHQVVQGLRQAAGPAGTRTCSCRHSVSSPAAVWKLHACIGPLLSALPSASAALRRCFLQLTAPALRSGTPSTCSRVCIPAVGVHPHIMIRVPGLRRWQMQRPRQAAGGWPRLRLAMPFRQSA